MSRWTGSRPQMWAALAATVVIPVYLGLAPAAVWQMLLYSIVAAAALATGDYLDQTHRARRNSAVLMQEALLWWLVIAGLGGFSYAAARGAGRWLSALHPSIAGT